MIETMYAALRDPSEITIAVLALMIGLGVMIYGRA